MGNEAAIKSKTPTVKDNGSIVEPRPRLDTVGSDEMFLSPRVVDAGAFARYAETLKGIIAQASAQGRTLEDFSADAEAMIKRCSETNESVNKRLQAGIRMLKMIDERAERTDLLLEKVQRALPDAQAMSDRIDRMIDERLHASEARIEVVIAKAEQRAQAAERRAHEAIERTQEHAAELESLGQSIDERLSSLREVIERSVAEREGGIESLQQQVDAARAQINDSIAQAFDKAKEAGEAISSRASESMNAIESRVDRVDRAIEPLVEASSRAMRALGMDPENPVFEDSPLSRIESLVDRGEMQLASLDRVYRQLEDLQSQAESVRSAFGHWLIDAAEQLDTLEERKERVVGPMQDAAKTILSLGPDLDQKLQLASTQLNQLQIEQKTLREAIAASSQVANQVTDRMSNHSGQLQALLDGSLHKLSTRVEQAGVWLGTLIQRAEGLASSLPGAGSMEFVPAAPAPAESAPVSVGRAPEVVGSINEPDAFERAVIEEIEEIKSVVVPRPPQLPIDALSFDGSSDVIKHKDAH